MIKKLVPLKILLQVQSPWPPKKQLLTQKHTIQLSVFFQLAFITRTTSGWAISSKTKPQGTTVALSLYIGHPSCHPTKCVKALNRMQSIDSSCGKMPTGPCPFLIH